VDDISTRTIIIAVNIFITITIVSLVIVMFSQMGEIYGVVAETDTSIASRFDDIYSMYHGKVESGIGLLNTVKRFADDAEYDKYGKIIINYTDDTYIREAIEEYNVGRTEISQITEIECLKIVMEKSRLTSEAFKEKYGDKSPNVEKVFSYEDKYNVTVEENSNKEIIIKYTKMN